MRIFTIGGTLLLASPMAWARAVPTIDEPGVISLLAAIGVIGVIVAIRNRKK